MYVPAVHRTLVAGAVVLTGLVTSAGCTRAATQLVVSVRSDLPPERIECVRVVSVPTVPGEPLPATGARETLFVSDAVRLPFSFAVLPPADGRTQVQLTVSALDGCDADARTSVSRTVRTGFVEGQKIHVPLALEAACYGVVCGEAETCERGRCVASTLEAASLQPVERGTETRLDASFSDAPLVGVAFHESFDDLDYTSGPAGERYDWYGGASAARWEVVEEPGRGGVLHLSRLGSGSAGGGMLIQYELGRLLAPGQRVRVRFAYRVVRDSLPGLGRVDCGEMPAMVAVSVRPGARALAGVDPTHPTGSLCTVGPRVVVRSATLGEWGVFDEDVTDAVRASVSFEPDEIRRIEIGAAGWEVDAYFDDLEVIFE